MALLLSVSAFLFSVRVAPVDAAARLPSFSCWWTEPFDGFEISPNGAKFFSAETLDGSGTPLSRLKVVAKGGGYDISGMAGAEAITVKITKEPGSDGMSDYSTPYAARLNDQWSGACVRHGVGTVPRTVVGVATADVLNVRAAPSSNSKIVATIPPGGSAWVYPGKTSKGWLKVSARRYARNESGDVTVVDGWVNGAFVSK